MLRKLPYPGYSWSFTQHAVGLEAETLFNILACAACFEGFERPGAQITNLMIKNNLLTANYRDGQADAWRDYQQLLAETGLIYSTKLVSILTITPLGKQFLAREIGFGELMTLQAMRYQYPNGQKFVIQSRLKGALVSRGHKVPENLIELQVSHGVLIKPGLLILRILLELQVANQNAILTVDEIMNCLMPLLSNRDWKLAYNDLVSYRKKPFEVAELEPANKRNVQDWLKFLSKSDIFEMNNGWGSIKLSKLSMSRISELCEYVADQEEGGYCWIPRGYDTGTRASWFGYFGRIDVDVQPVFLYEQLNHDYIEENYVAGIVEEEEFQPSSEIKLQEHQPRAHSNPDVDSGDLDLISAIRNLKSGILSRKIKARLHDDIVSELSEYFQRFGGKVFEDPNSVDLLVVWPDNSESLIEVKTVTATSIQHRLRLAIGQVQEYAYRRKIEVGVEPDISIAIDTIIPTTAWQVDFLNNYINAALICKKTDSDPDFYFPIKFNMSRFVT